MQHLDEGTIHAWLDGALDAAEGARVEEHVASCASCAAAVAEARGLVAGASRILTSLDHVPGNVAPRVASGGGPERGGGQGAARRRGIGGEGTVWRALRLTPARAAAAAVLIVAVGTMLVARQQGGDFAQFSAAPMAVDTSVHGPAVPPPAAAPQVASGAPSATAPTSAPLEARQARPGNSAEAPALVAGGTGAAGGGSVLRGRKAARPTQQTDVAAASGNATRRDDAGANVARRRMAVAAPNEPVRDQAAGRGGGVGAGAPARSLKAMAVTQDSVAVAQRQERGRREGLAAEAVVAAPLPAPARDELRVARDARFTDLSSTVAVAGCYAVTTSRPLGLPARISLDTARALGPAAAFAAPPSAQVAAPSAVRRLESAVVPSRASESTVVRRVSIPDTTNAGKAGVSAGSWTQLNPTMIRVILGGGTTLATTLRVEIEGTGSLRGVVENRDASVTLQRVDCP